MGTILRDSGTKERAFHGNVSRKQRPLFRTGVPLFRTGVRTGTPPLTHFQVKPAPNTTPLGSMRLRIQLTETSKQQPTVTLREKKKQQMPRGEHKTTHLASGTVPHYPPTKLPRYPSTDPL